MKAALCHFIPVFISNCINMMQRIKLFDIAYNLQTMASL